MPTVNLIQLGETPIVLPADHYDYIHLCSLAFDGIGAGSDFIFRDSECNCAMGFYMPTPLYATSPVELEFAHQIRDARTEIYTYISRGINDIIVYRVNQKKNMEDLTKKVTFEEWCEEGNIHRGNF